MQTRSLGLHKSKYRPACVKRADGCALTGLSSDTSHPRYSAACIIWAIIRSTSCFAANTTLFSNVAYMIHNQMSTIKQGFVSINPSRNSCLNYLQSCQGLRCHLCHRAWKQLKREGEMKMEVLGQEITQINCSLSTHTPACPWAVHPPAVRSNTKHPSERPPLWERQRRGRCQCSAHPISKKQDYTGMWW